jgi:rhodanese-related sulfurtransferase
MPVRHDGIANWSREEIRAGLKDGRVLLVDVREPHEFAMGHMPGAVNMPLSFFNPADIPDAPGREIVFSCAAGVRSLRAIDMAQSAGLAFDAHYPGGFKDWLMNGEDVAGD